LVAAQAGQHLAEGAALGRGALSLGHGVLSPSAGRPALQEGVRALVGADPVGGALLLRRGLAALPRHVDAPGGGRLQAVSPTLEGLGADGAPAPVGVASHHARGGGGAGGRAPRGPPAGRLAGGARALLPWLGHQSTIPRSSTL